ncbi:hypothetical protein D3C87_1918800 [compost metagenome]
MLEAAAGLHAENDLMDAVGGGIDPIVDEAGILLSPEVPGNISIGNVAGAIEDRTR